mmetsp:Transcript_33582/g.68089  ORF Transcript_33582/g.68089 Transcript_33582/m.68089 type:complete len:113 (-) Transcript_33582:118-456(-)
MASLRMESENALRCELFLIAFFVFFGPSSCFFSREKHCDSGLAAGACCFSFSSLLRLNLERFFGPAVSAEVGRMLFIPSLLARSGTRDSGDKGGRCAGFEGGLIRGDLECWF